MRTFLTVIIAIFAAISCHTASAADDLAGVKFLVEMVAGADTIDTGQTSFLISQDGTVATSIGCNRLAGKATLEGTNVQFGPLMSTRKACAPKLMEHEHLYAGALSKVRSFKIDGHLTTFLDVNGAVLVALARAAQ
ncbi:MAG: META domain-containing protein [Hyphomicrobium sp.]